MKTLLINTGGKILAAVCVTPLMLIFLWLLKIIIPIAPEATVSNAFLSALAVAIVNIANELITKTYYKPF